jgi:formimidoylglutamate deiminase
LHSIAGERKDSLVMPQVYQFERGFTPEGWRAPLWVEVDDAGWIAAVHHARPGEAPEVVVSGAVLPGVPNLHSHAFQRALSGRAETSGSGDSFWSWREAMYRAVSVITPDDLEAIAAQAFVEMLEAGYTSVAEFHYLHNAAGGDRYADLGELSLAVVRAAKKSGIGLTLLPVLYTGSGFGKDSAAPEQLRFVLRPDELADLVGELLARHAGDPELRFGIAPHSLRAVSAEGFVATIEALRSIDPEAPIHVHAAEQLREVEECRAFYGMPPIAWLLDKVGVDRRWCVVHATHADPSELVGLASSAAVVGLCPTTEANLGDGIFPLRQFLDGGGVFGIGSDSNVCSNPAEELRWLEYGQRLRALKRNVAADAGEPSTGARLYRTALRGGTRALARPIGAIAPGLRADLVVLDTGHPALVAREPELIIDGWIFSAQNSPVRDVMVGGRWVVQGGRHAGRDAIASAFGRVLTRLYRA